MLPAPSPPPEKNRFRVATRKTNNKYYVTKSKSHALGIHYEALAKGLSVSDTLKEYLTHI